MKKTVINWDEASEIADSILKVENKTHQESITNQALANKWGIDIATFEDIINKIFNQIDFGISPLTQTLYAGIVRENKPEWLAKKEVSRKFINAVIYWITEGQDFPKNKAMQRTITKNGVPEFEVIIKHSK